jgi:hypothetical protein
VLDTWRRTGADLPYGDLGADRGTPFEGWYWRFSDPSSGRVVVGLCGGMRTWALGALATNSSPPARRVEHAIVASTAEVLGENASIRAGASHVEAEITDVVAWPRRMLGALGPAHLLPWMPQYWQPLVLRATARGHAVVRGEHVAIDGWHAYHEKNWGPAFAGDWWWGQAHLGEDVDVAFAGGHLLGPLAATAVVLRLGDEVIALAPPALVRTRIGDGTWAVDARSARYHVTIEADGSNPHTLPVPAGERRTEPRSHQVLAGRLRLTVRRGRRVVIDTQTALAGLERGFRAPRRVELPARAAQPRRSAAAG